jgi:serine/threonine protein kinase
MHVIHRDIKFENVIVLPDLSIKIIDFGYGLVLNPSNPRQSRYCGTPYYMPPELILGLNYDGKE